MPASPELLADATIWRHDFHRHPELRFDVERTAGRVAELLRQFGCDEVAEGIGKTGVAAVVKGSLEPGGRIVGIRADMDALPIAEETGLALCLDSARDDACMRARRAHVDPPRRGQALGRK